MQIHMLSSLMECGDHNLGLPQLTLVLTIASVSFFPSLYAASTRRRGERIERNTAGYTWTREES